MNVSVLERESAAKIKLDTIDCDIHPGVANISELTAFLPERWKEHMKTYGAFLRGGNKESSTTHFRMTPQTARADSFPPNGKPPGSDLDFMREQHLDANGIEYGILVPLRTGAGAQRNLEYGAALASAMNDWQVAHWVDPEPRLRGSIVIAMEDPAAAVREIEKRAKDGRFAQIFIPPKTSEPLGRPIYWPILDAASELGIPIGLHVGGMNGFANTGAGWPSFYIEDHHTNVQAMQGLLTSLTLEGTFERFPKLRMVLVEGGFAWAPALGWRLDKAWARMRDEVPHCTRPPSEIMREHVWYTTQPIDEPQKPRQLLDIMEWIGFDRIMFSTDYPHWDFDDPKYVFKAPLNPAEKEMVFRGNAKAFYGLT